MSERISTSWRLLIQNLEVVLEWPSVLIPLVAGYVQVPAYEWDAESANCRSGIDTITNTRIERHPMTGGGKRLHVRSKYSLGAGPRHWGVELEAREWIPGDQIWIGISSAQYAGFACYVHLVLNTHPLNMQLSFYQSGNLAFRRDVPLRDDAGKMKYQIYVMIRQEKAEFALGHNSVRSYLGTSKLSSYLDYFYPTISAWSNGSAYSITLLEE
jgi:hypothetical protein